MPDNGKITDDERDLIVRLYKEGQKIAEITKVTGRPRPTIYWVLQQKGVHPSRIHRPAVGEVTVLEVLDRLRDADREVALLRAELDRREVELEKLRARLRKFSAK